MFTLNGWGTTLYGSTRRQEIDIASTEFAHRNGLPPYSFQAVKWFTAAFLPIVPLGVYRVTKIKQGSLLFGDSEYVMVPVQWDRRQVITHYVVGWSLPFAIIGTIAGLEMLDQYLIRRGITNVPFAPFAVLSLIVGGILFFLWWRTRPLSMRNVGPASSVSPLSQSLPSETEQQLVPPIRTPAAQSTPEQTTAAQRVGPHAGRTRGLVAWVLILAGLFVSSSAVFACAGGAYLVWRASANRWANEQAQRAARAGQRVGPNTRLAKGTQLQVRRRAWEDVKVVQDSEFGMVRIQWIEPNGHPRGMSVPRSRLRWPHSTTTRHRPE